MHKLEFHKAISLIEFGAILFVLFFIYTFVFKQMFADIKFSDMKRFAGIAYGDVAHAERSIKEHHSGFVNTFSNEYDIINIFSSELSAEQACQNAKTDGCWSDNWLWANYNKPGLKLNSGEYVVSELISSSCNSNINIIGTCAALYVDTNGSQQPNKIGQDIIKIYITEKGFVPAGVKEDIINPASSCDMVNKFSWGCTAKLLGMK